jgi:stage III sporulation protein AA
MITIKQSPFEQAVSYLKPLKAQFTMPRHITDTVREVRLRAGQPVVLETNDGRIRLTESVSPEQLQECVREFCGYSIHSHEKQFREGWLTLRGGHRAGFTGTAVLGNRENERVENIRDISSVNLRIARQFIGCADDLYSRMLSDEGELTGLLIVGRPMSAKTTILRDLCRQISGKHKVALIDERGEVAAIHNSIPSLDVGENTDVLNNFPKGQGIMTALRSLSPEFVICDEIGWEVAELAALANSGVRMVMTAHSGGLKEAYSSARIRRLLSAGGISHIAVLGFGKNIGKVEFYGTNKHSSNNSSNPSDSHGDSSGAVFFLSPENARG